MIQRDHIETLPNKPGVYLFKDEKNRVIYVGKAKDIKKRVASYFVSSRLDGKTSKLLEKAVNVDFILVPSEKEALILEGTLIKRHRPKYNVILKDDKNYLSIRIDPNDTFPTLQLVRKHSRDGALYFGPFVSAKAARKTIQWIGSIFPLRKCKGKSLPKVSRSCLNHQMKRCLAPCVGKVSIEEYHQLVREVVLFLKGKRRDLIDMLKKQMKKAADKEKFEEAAILRDRIYSIEKTLEKQDMVSMRAHDMDIVGAVSFEDDLYIDMLSMRDGVLMDSHGYFYRDLLAPIEEVISSFLYQFYSTRGDIPEKIILPFRVEAMDTLRERLKEIRGKKVEILVPIKGKNKKLLDMAMENARANIERMRARSHQNMEIISKLKKEARLINLPESIECADVSDIAGIFPVGGIVRFTNAEMDKAMYRLYRLQDMPEPNDYLWMYELIERHIERRLRAGKLPTLLLIDGGKGHLKVAERVIKEKGLTGKVDLLAIAKEKASPLSEKKVDRVYKPGRKNPLSISKSSLHLLMRIRDEAHRFAKSYHIKIRKKSTLSSFIDYIPGIGFQRKKILLSHFGSIDRLSKASLEEIKTVKGIPNNIAEKVYQYIRLWKERL